MLLSIIVLLVTFLGGGETISHAAEGASEARQQEGGENVVTGILEDLDLTRLKGRLKTDLGKPIFFQVSKPELFERISVGQHVTVQLDQEGRAIKVIDVPVPELKHP